MGEDTKMNKRLLYTPLLMLAPLLMANMPAPFAATDTYGDVSISNVSQTGNTIYFDLTNNGDQYICEGSSMTPIYGRLIKGDVSYACTDYLTGFETYALTHVDENVTCTNPVLTKTGDKVYTFNAEITGKGDYYYATVIDVTYKEKDYCFGFSDWFTDANKIETTEELELDKLEIKKVTFFRSRNNTYKGGYNVGSLTTSTQPNTSPIGSTNKNTPSNDGVYGKVAVDPTVPLLVALVVIAGISIIVAPVVIVLVVSKKKKK